MPFFLPLLSSSLLRPSTVLSGSHVHPSVHCKLFFSPLTAHTHTPAWLYNYTLSLLLSVVARHHGDYSDTSISWWGSGAERRKKSAHFSTPEAQPSELTPEPVVLMPMTPELKITLNYNWTHSDMARAQCVCDTSKHWVSVLTTTSLFSDWWKFFFPFGCFSSNCVNPSCFLWGFFNFMVYKADTKDNLHNTLQTVPLSRINSKWWQSKQTKHTDIPEAALASEHIAIKETCKS